MGRRGTGGRKSWTSERRAGNQLATDDDDNFEVDSAMLAPLAELHDRNVSEGRGRLRAATKRRRAIYAAAVGFVVMLVIYASAGGAASFKWATANNVCEHLRFESTEGGDVGEWARWVKAVSKVYLKNRVLALPDASSHPEEVDAAKACAADGWTRPCTERIFRHNARVQDQIRQIEHDRNLLGKSTESGSCRGASVCMLTESYLARGRVRQDGCWRGSPAARTGDTITGGARTRVQEGGEQGRIGRMRNGAKGRGMYRCATRRSGSHQGFACRAAQSGCGID